MKDQLRKWKNAHLNIVPNFVVRHIALKRMAERNFMTPGIHYKIASSQEELESALTLLQRSYVERGIAGSKSFRMKIRNILPTTTTFIALRGDTVVGTVSLIEDCELGLPIEQVHASDVARVRNRHRKLAEVGALALEKSERRSAISIMLFNMLYRWARNWRHVDDLLIGIHPSARHFYAAVLQFNQIGSSRSYEALNGAASVPMVLDAAGAQMRFHRLYSHKIIDRSTGLSFYDLFCAPCDRFDFSCHPDFRSLSVATSPLQQGDVSAMVSDLARLEGGLAEKEIRILQQYFPKLNLAHTDTASQPEPSHAW
ncbi:hypothetical protein [uncultured Celeribacter sp.]|uniref:N-acyl amino acid synthase FeeM domain-containing protein n=1 Tax=uncultured Celeribacter sp. TaxID=1303376 RepID=UPI002AA814DE|nr:hypothetical protein [uncultured Celeribacter sp.]